jgi:hypothetical protein
MQPYSPTPADLPRRTPVRACGISDVSAPRHYHFSIFEFSVFEYGDSVCLKLGCLESGVRSLWLPISSIVAFAVQMGLFILAC